MRANIFLNELDKYVEEELMPQYTRGARRAVNPEYRRLSNAMIKAKKAGDTQRMLALKKERSSVSYGMPDDPNYRRLRYVRYADDFLIGFTGPKAEAEIIRAKVGEFLKKLKLELSAEKTFVTHATEQRARFLSYEIGMARADSRKCAGRRSINGQPVMTVPQDVINKWKGKVTQGQKPIHRAELVNSSDYDIVMTYQMEFQGLVNYYTKAHNVSELYRVKDVYRQSLAKTLAAKHKKHVTWVFRRYGKTSDAGVKCFEVVVPRAGKQPLVARFGAARIIFRRFGYIEDKVRRLLPGRNELIKRLLADQCEFCGQTTEVEVHHIRKLKTLINEHKGKPSPPQWVTRMAEMRRKTLVVCRQCHTAIHSGRYDGPKIG